MSPDLHDMTCGTCGRTWNSETTPTPSARCPFEAEHGTARIVLSCGCCGAPVIARSDQTSGYAYGASNCAGSDSRCVADVGHAYRHVGWCTTCGETDCDCDDVDPFAALVESSYDDSTPAPQRGAIRAAQTLGHADAYDRETIVQDALTDLQHLADALGIDWAETLAAAERMHDDEIAHP